MTLEPDIKKHYIFSTYEQAMEAWDALTKEQKEKINPPRQSHKCWIFDRDEA
jgi:hypothetical protein